MLCTSWELEFQEMYRGWVCWPGQERNQRGGNTCGVLTGKRHAAVDGLPLAKCVPGRNVMDVPRATSNVDGLFASTSIEACRR